MAYRVEKTALNASGKMYQPGDVIPDDVVGAINPKNLKILFAEGVITKDGYKVEASAEVAPPSLESGDPEISLVAEESTISPAELAAELIAERGGDGAPERTEEDVLREMAEKDAEAKAKAEDEELQKELDGTLMDGLEEDDQELLAQDADEGAPEEGLGAEPLDGEDEDDLLDDEE